MLRLKLNIFDDNMTNMILHSIVRNNIDNSKFDIYKVAHFNVATFPLLTSDVWAYMVLKPCE